MLHLTNGDAAADPLRRSGVPGDVIVWFDVLHEGPTPRGHGAAWRETRTEYLTDAGYASRDEILRLYDTADAALERYREHEELVLWFEHDLFDQLLIARHLHWLGTHGHLRTRLSMVCIDRFAGIEPFHGLGQLHASQLASLFPARQPITRETLAAGADVWRAFTSDDPRALCAIVQYGVDALPFMAGALRRHLEEFPGADDGLSRTERTILGELATAPRSPAALFRAVADREERVFMADTVFLRILRDLSRAPEPLVTLTIDKEREGCLPIGLVAITEQGSRVLTGADAIALRGINRWLGGVHLMPGALWRWDPRAQTLIPNTIGLPPSPEPSTS